MKSPWIVVLPILIMLAVGWMLVLIEFGKSHTDYVQSPHVHSGIYSSAFLQFWVFCLGVPAVIVLVGFHTYKGSENDAFGLLAHCAEFITTLALGGCLSFTVAVVNITKISSSVRGVSVAGLIGELVSLLCLGALLAIVPLVIERYCNNVAVNSRVPYNNITPTPTQDQFVQQFPVITPPSTAMGVKKQYSTITEQDSDSKF